MLRLDNLDDMRFAEITQQALMKISEYFPQWSDYNTHDPGITLIELFAWLTEQQRFYMDQSEEAYPFFPLLGVTLRGVSAAETRVEIQGGYAPRLISCNTPLYAEEVRFETTEDTFYDGTPTTVRIIQRETVRTPIVLGTAQGYPGESFTVDTKGQIILDFALTVAGELWTIADNFRASRPEDRHYTLNRETGDLSFGNGFRGALPYGEVLITHMALTRGSGGNIVPHRIAALDDLPVSQPMAAKGGVMRETVNDALRRSTASRRQAVTAEDIERIVLEIPGLDIECVHAFDSRDAPQIGKPRVINISIKLRSGSLTEEIRQAVLERLEPYRLVCRDYHITTPKVVRVSLSLELRTGPHGSGYKRILETSLRSFFEHNCGGFGAALRVSEFHAFITDLPESPDVTRCAFRVYGGAKTTAAGDILLGPDEIAELSEVLIAIAGRDW